jgi:hypothetical protein
MSSIIEGSRFGTSGNLGRPPGEKEKVPGRLSNDLRRKAVRNMIRAGVPQSVAMSITGHETDSVFRRYDTVSPEDKILALRRTQIHLAAAEEEQHPAVPRWSTDKTRTIWGSTGRRMKATVL